MKIRYTLLVLTLVLSSTLMGQKSLKNGLNNKESEDNLQQDTLPTLLYQFYFGNLDSLNMNPLRVKDIQFDPYYFRLFTPMTFYRSPMDQVSKSLWTYKEPGTTSDLNSKLLPFDDSEFHKSERTNKQVNRILLDFYVNHPELVTKHEDQILSKKVLKAEATPDTPKKSVIQLFKVDVPETMTEADIVIHKPNFWVSGGNGSLQFTQNYISSNWHKGGESNNSLLSNVLFYMNYNDKEKLQLENSLEVKIGLNTVSSDTLHKYKVNTDVLRLYSKLGIQAAQKWYYTVSAEFNTQLLNNYKKNSDELSSAFMAPANLILSVGMDYKLKKKKINLSAFISPAAYNMRYVGNKEVNETAFGLDEGKKFLHDLGSKFQSNLTWEVFPSVVWTSRLYYFTNYEKVEAEWENTFDFVLNRYLSTKLFVHGRFDDGVKRMEGKNYFQLKELLSFGINYKW